MRLVCLLFCRIRLGVKHFWFVHFDARALKSSGIGWKNQELNMGCQHRREAVWALSLQKDNPGKWFIPALFICFFAASGNVPILRLFAVNIATEMHIPVGVVAQLTTVNSIAEVIFAVLMAFLAVRFKHRSLLLAGIGLVAVSAVGCFFAPNIWLMLFFFGMEGAGTVMVSVTGLTLIGEKLPMREKGKAIGNMIAAGSIAGILGTFLLGFIVNFSGWRFSFIFYVMPTAIIGLALTFLALSSKPDEKPFGTGGKAYLASFKEVFLNRSAVSCLVGGLLMSVTGLAVFSMAFFNQHFKISLWTVVVLGAAIATTVVVASMVSGRLINRFGRKNLTVGGALGGSILAMGVFFMPTLLLSTVFAMAHVFLIWTAITAYQAYVLEQAPKARSTMMSMRNIFSNLGEAVGAALGGALLIFFSFDLSFSYQTVGLAFGTIGIVGSAVFFFLTKDPTRALALKPEM